VGSAYVHGIMYGALMEATSLAAKFEEMVLVQSLSNVLIAYEKSD
jgi:hypothetical protein